MRLSFEIPVLVNGKTGRSASQKTVLASVPHVYDLPEYSLDEAPLALAYQQRPLGSAPQLERVEYRALDNALWTDAGNIPERGETVRLTIARDSDSTSPFFGGRHGLAKRIWDALYAAEQARRPAAQTVAPNSLVRYMVEKADTYVPEPLVNVGISSDISEQVAKQIDAYEDTLRQFCVVDGRLYRKEKEPLIRLLPDGRWLSSTIERRGHASKPSRVLGDIPRSVGWFRLDDREGMQNEASVILDRMGQPGPLSDNIGRIEIYDAALLSASPESIAIFDVADAMQRHLHESVAAGSRDPGAAMGRWFATCSNEDVALFRAFSGKMRGEPITEELPAELEEAYLTVAEGDPADFRCFTGAGNLRAFVEETARRWRDRPLTVNVSPAAHLLL